MSRPDARRRLGTTGEDLAAAWYQARGYEVLARNWRCDRGELDLVLRRPGEIVFCEVKNRSSLAFGSGFDAVTVTKQRRLRLLAQRWLAQSTASAPYLRFDVAAVLAGELEVMEGAF